MTRTCDHGIPLGASPKIIPGDIHECAHSGCEAMAMGPFPSSWVTYRGGKYCSVDHAIDPENRVLTREQRARGEDLFRSMVALVAVRS